MKYVSGKKGESNMTFTSAQAAKLIRKLNEEKDLLLTEEKENREFTAALQEDVESVRPPYDFLAMQEAVAAIDAKIRRAKHTINVFNTTHEVPGFNMTIDAMLVYLPQLKETKEKLIKMAKRPEKRRSGNGYGSGGIIDYTYANYDIAKVKERLAEVTDELSRAQTALDLINSQETMDIDI